MIRSLLLGAALVFALSCVGRQNRDASTPATARRADGPNPVTPAVAPEADPDNVERRFGFAEARARREKAAADAHRDPARVDVVTDGKVTPGQHDHSAAGALPVAVAKPGEHQHGAEGQDKTGGKPMCPCMAGQHDSAAATK